MEKKDKNNNDDSHDCMKVYCFHHTILVTTYCIQYWMLCMQRIVFRKLQYIVFRIWCFNYVSNWYSVIDTVWYNVTNNNLKHSKTMNKLKLQIFWKMFLGSKKGPSQCKCLQVLLQCFILVSFLTYHFDDYQPKSKSDWYVLLCFQSLLVSLAYCVFRAELRQNEHKNRHVLL